MENEKVFFLITDLDVLDGSHQLVHRLSSPKLNAIVYAIVPDCETLKNIRHEFPTVNFLLCNLTEALNINKEILACLPGLDCIINYSGEHFSNALHRLRDMRIAKTATYESEGVSIKTVFDEMNSNTQLGLVLINVKKITHHGSTCSEALANLIRKETKKREEEEGFPEGFKFLPGLKYRQPSPSPSPVIASTSASTSQVQNVLQNDDAISQLPQVQEQRNQTELQPLLRKTCSHSRQKPSQPRTVSTIRTLCFSILCSPFPYCCPGLVRTTQDGNDTPVFQTEEELRAYSRWTHHLVLRRKLRRLIDMAEADWYRIMTRIDSDLVFKLEDLNLEIKARKMRETQELERRLEAEIEAEKRAKRMGGTLREQLERARRARERFVGRISEHDYEKEFEERNQAIKRMMKGERILMEREHYCLWVQKQLELVRALREKERGKFEALYEQAFQREAPFECVRRYY